MQRLVPWRVVPHPPQLYISSSGHSRRSPWHLGHVTGRTLVIDSVPMISQIYRYPLSNLKTAFLPLPIIIITIRNHKTHKDKTYLIKGNQRFEKVEICILRHPYSNAFYYSGVGKIDICTWYKWSKYFIYLNKSWPSRRIQCSMAPCNQLGSIKGNERII